MMFDRPAPSAAEFAEIEAVIDQYVNQACEDAPGRTQTEPDGECDTEDV